MTRHLTKLEKVSRPKTRGNLLRFYLLCRLHIYFTWSHISMRKHLTMSWGPGCDVQLGYKYGDLITMYVLNVPDQAVSRIPFFPRICEEKDQLISRGFNLLFFFFFFFCYYFFRSNIITLAGQEWIGSGLGLSSIFQIWTQRPCGPNHRSLIST